MNKRKKGNDGEDIAVDYLEKKGYRILHRNYRYERGEIDIIVQDSDTLVFVEVKARHSDKYGLPIESVTESKQRQIRKVADGYLFENEIDDVSCRFDVVSILFVEGKPNIEHFEDAF